MLQKATVPPVIRVDGEVWEWLKSRATPFEDTPNTVLRRLAGLDTPERAVRDDRDGLDVPGADPAKALIEFKITSPRLKGLVGDGRNYIVTKRRDKYPHWWFQIYRKKLDRKARNENGAVVVVCDYGSPTQKTFAVPYRYLRDKVLPKAHLEPDDRYMFDVVKEKLEFVFRGGVRFDGRQFLVS